MFSFLFHTKKEEKKKRNVYHKITHDTYLQIFTYMILIDNLFL